MILTYPNPLLQRVIGYDPLLDDDEVICEMLEAAIVESRTPSHGSILGLAANQIGIETRIILYRDQEEGYLKALVNPKITRYSEPTWIEVEACGSLPGYEVEVPRSRYIITESKEGWNMFEEWEARIIQHEIDHLNGIMIFHREVVNGP